MFRSESRWSNKEFKYLDPIILIVCTPVQKWVLTPGENTRWINKEFKYLDTIIVYFTHPLKHFELRLCK